MLQIFIAFGLVLGSGLLGYHLDKEGNVTAPMFWGLGAVTGVVCASLIISGLLT